MIKYTKSLSTKRKSMHLSNEFFQRMLYKEDRTERRKEEYILNFVLSFSLKLLCLALFLKRKFLLQVFRFLHIERRLTL